MESLLCDEVWLTSPDTCLTASFYTTNEDREQAFSICLYNECNYMPKPRYLEHLISYNLIMPRFMAVQWLIKTQKRLNLSFGTLFNAANYLDRFISSHQCKEWKLWMYELLSIACLSIASKFGDTTSPPLREFQKENQHRQFQQSMIQRMELSVLNVLGWRLNSTTPYSYVELLIQNVESSQPFLLEELTARITDLLLITVLDFNFVELRPSTLAMSSLQRVQEELSLSSLSSFNTQLAHVAKLIPQQQKEELTKCHKMMGGLVVDPWCTLKSFDNCPSSPVTVLTKERAETYDCPMLLCLVNEVSSTKNIKGKQEDK